MWFVRYGVPAAVVVVAVSTWAILTQGGDAWLGHTFGLDNGDGPWYLFWSGMGANFGELSLVAAIVGAYRHKKCDVKGCWRLQWREYVDADGVKHLWCKKHHPTRPVHWRDVETFIERHERRKATD